MTLKKIRWEWNKTTLIYQLIQIKIRALSNIRLINRIIIWMLITSLKQLRWEGRKPSKLFRKLLILEVIQLNDCNY